MINDERGYTYLQGVYTMLFFLLLFVLVMNIAITIASYSRAHESIKNAMEAGVKEHYVTRDNDVYINEPDCVNDFFFFLRDNLKLDNSNMPIDSSIYTGQVVVEDIRFYRPGENCYMTGEVFNYPTMHTEVLIPIDILFSNLVGGQINMRIHHDVSYEDIL